MLAYQVIYDTFATHVVVLNLDSGQEESRVSIRTSSPEHDAFVDREVAEAMCRCINANHQ